MRFSMTMTRKHLTTSLALVAFCATSPAWAQTTQAEKPAPETAQVGPFEVAPHWTRYPDYPKSIPEGQAYYIVVKGDTLWDISGRFLGNPFLWPQIWEANSYIKKARLIYPGDPIFLPSVTLASAAAAAAMEEETTTGEEALAPLGTPEWLDMDALVTVASPDLVRFSGYITASPEDESLKIKGMEAEHNTAIEKRIVATRDYLYLNRGANAGLKAGDLYSIHRRVRAIKHPVTGKRVGHRVETTGVARVILVGESSARAVVESSGRDVQVGDYLRPLVEVESPLVKRRVVVEGGDLSTDGARSSGYVVDIDDTQIAAGTGLTVGVDMGSGAGMAVGNVVTVFRQTDKSDPVTRRPMGAAVVVAVRENFSVARVVYAREEMHVGDRVIVQP
jgi:hypothetical protein